MYPHTPNKIAPNNTRELDPLSQPSPPDVIPYKANVPGDPNLWDGNFGVISLFGMNEFLRNDVNNMTTSLLHMATFLNQRKLDDQDGNDIYQLSSFGDTTWQFILAIYKSGWNQLYIMANISFKFMVKSKFTKNIPQTSSISKLPYNSIARKVSPPLFSRPTKEQLRKSKFQSTEKNKSISGKTSAKSFAQATATAKNILKIREAFLALPKKK